MTTKDFCVKWLAYALALLPVWFAETYVFSAVPLFGVKPMLLPLAAVAVATLEGATGGAGFGLAVGALMDAMLPGLPGGKILFMTLAALGAGLLSRYVLRQNLVGCFLCSVMALALLDLGRVALRLLTGAAPATVLLALAGKEILWSLCFAPLVYGLFLWVFNRVPKATVI